MINKLNSQNNKFMKGECMVKYGQYIPNFIIVLKGLNKIQKCKIYVYFSNWNENFTYFILLKPII
jgi:hypothetical protein